MKRLITYISLFAAILAVSCNQMEPVDFSEDAGMVRFDLRSAEMETRVATDPNAVDNENLIKWVDYFFFKKNDGTLLIEHARQEFTGTEERVLEFNTNVAPYTDLRKPFYAYFLVNYCTKRIEGEGEEATEVIEYIDHSKTDWTLEKLLSLPISTNFTPTDEEGKEVKVPEFIMDSGEDLVYVKAEQQGDRIEKTVRLSHIAAKLILNFTVANSVSALGDTWTPITNQMTVRYWNALNSTTVDAEPIERTDASPKANYFNYPDEAPTKNGNTFSSRLIYTYPQLFGEKSGNKISYKNGEPYFKISLPWNGAKFGATRFYYKILLPNLEKIERNKYYVLTLAINQLGGVEDEYVTLTDKYYVVDWQTPDPYSQAGLTESRFLDIALPSYSFYAKNDMNVPVISSHPISVTILSASKEVFRSNASTAVSQDSGFPKTNGNTDFTLQHTLITDPTKSNYDCGIITYQVRVFHSDDYDETDLDHSTYKDVTIYQYPQVYIKQKTSNGSVFVNNYSYANTSGDHYAYNNNSQAIGTIVNPSTINGNGDNVNQHQYNVYVSVLPTGNTSTIGDPRVGGTAVNNLGSNVRSNYKSTGESTQNVIAPAIKIASSYGKTYPMQYERAKERCASYQENGYPAGRWRLPTVAEIRFLIQLSENNHIPTLFDPGYDSNGYYAEYWAGGGWAFLGSQSYLGASVPALDFSSGGNKSHDGVSYSVTLPGNYSNSYSVTYNYRNYTNQVWTRCVYDIWYWGDDPDSSHMTSWGGFQMD